MGNDAVSIVACIKLKFFHLEGGGLNHQRDYQILGALNIIYICFYPLFHIYFKNYLGTGSVQFQTHGMEKISAKDKPCSIMPKATAGTRWVVK